VDFKDEDLRRLYTDATFHHPRFGSDLTRQFRKQVSALYQAKDMRDLYALRSLRFEKLRGPRDGQHSIRLNDQWRLVVEVVEAEPRPSLLVLEVVDYHQGTEDQ
jgi:proteic killer suppression protein